MTFRVINAFFPYDPSGFSARIYGVVIPRDGLVLFAVLVCFVIGYAPAEFEFVAGVGCGKEGGG